MSIPEPADKQNFGAAGAVRVFVMASSKDYLNYLLGQLSGLDEITYRAMMGEYILYYRGKIAAYICDNRCW